MIRRALLGTAFALFAAAPAALAADGSSGCGPGWYLFKEVSLVSSSLRATTNAVLLPTTTIGMTFGTSNCSQHKIVQKDSESVKFANLAYHELIVQLAQGKGEHLAAFASTLGCPWQLQGEFNRTMQNAYQTIVPSDDVEAVEIVRQVRVEMQRFPTFAACGAQVG